MKALKIVAIIVAVLLVALIAVPFFIDVNMFRPQIEAQLSSALGRQVKIGNLKLSILSGSVAADDLSIADDPTFSKQPFIRAKGFNVGVELMPLILSKQLRVTEMVVDRPQVSLLRTEAGKWNFSSLGTKTASTGKMTAPAAKGSGGNPDLSVAKLSIKNGTVTLDNISDRSKPQVFQNVDIAVQHFSFTSKFPFTMSAGLPGGGNAKLNGSAGPMDEEDASLTPLQAKIALSDLNLAASGFIEPASGIAGMVDFNGTVSSDGRQARSSGTATVDKIKLSPKGSPASKAVEAKFTTTYELQRQTGQLTQGDVTIGKAVARLTGEYQMAKAIALNMKLNASNMPVDDLVTMIPPLGVTLPSGSSLKGGTLSGNFTIVGPLDKLVINGPVQLANTTLTGFNLQNKMAAISAISGAKTGSDLVVQNLSTDAHVAPEGISTQNVNLNLPALGVVTGSGTISPQNALNYTMNAKLSGSAVTGLTQVAGLGNKGGTIPFFIRGTTADPKFEPDVKGMLKGQLGDIKQNPAGFVNGISGMFGKKKKP
jgi:AsmA protein